MIPKKFPWISLTIAVAVVSMSILCPAQAEETAPAETTAVAAPAVETKPAEKQSPEKYGAYLWQEIDLAMKSLKAVVAQKEFERAREDASKVLELARRVVEHPLSQDAQYVKYLQGVLAHVQAFAETLDREAAKSNVMNVDFAYRKLSQQIENLRTNYQNIPAPAPAPAPAKSEKAAAPAEKPAAAKAEPAAKIEKPADTAAKPAGRNPPAKPKAAPKPDTAAKAAPAKKK